MYNLTKTYKTQAQAVNAIRMQARCKDWQVLDTDAAKQHVWPAANGFTVNNATLNAALGFAELPATDVSGALPQRVPAGTVTDGKALESVNAALEEAAPLSKADKALLQARLDAAKPANTKPVKETKAPAAKSVTQNGARRPAKEGKTLLVWEVAERLYKQLERTPTIKEVYAQLCSMDKGFNKTTCSIQFYACRTFHGWVVTK